MNGGKGQQKSTRPDKLGKNDDYEKDNYKCEEAYGEYEITNGDLFS